MKFRRPLHPRFRNQQTRYWSDMDELHGVLHTIPGHFKALMIDMMERPLSRQDIDSYFKELNRRVGRSFQKPITGDQIEKDLNEVVRKGVIEEREGKYQLTPAGLEISEHMREVVPWFMDQLFSPGTVSVATIGVHILLSILKLTFGWISGSAGLLADGVDNGVDTISSFLVWLGIKYDREKASSILIIVMMFLSLWGIGIATWNKIIFPGPVREGITAFSISAVCGLIMLLLSSYQYVAGKRSSSFAIMCQAVDSRNHILTSALVCGGILLSFLADSLKLGFLYYADALASAIIGLLILKSAVELLMELIKPGDGPAQISHFMASAQERVARENILEWLREQLKTGPMARSELEEAFQTRFCENTPQFLILSGIGYRPETSEDLNAHLEKFVREGRVHFENGKYSL